MKAARTILALAPLVFSSWGVKVFRNTLDFANSNATGGASLVGGAANVSGDFTLCLRFMLRRFARTDTEGRGRLLTVSDWREGNVDPEFQLLWVLAMHPTTFLGVGNPLGSAYASYLLREPTGSYEIFRPNVWNHFCLGYRKNDSYIRITKNGQSLNVDFAEVRLSNLTLPEDVLSKVYLGRCSFDYKPGCTTPGGTFADFNFWNEFLSAQQMAQWTTCGLTSKGNVVNWDLSEWKLDHMVEEEKPYQDLCQPLRPGRVLFPELRNFSSAVRLCQNMKAKMFVVKDQETQDDLIETMHEHIDDRINVWGGYTDQESEGVFYDVNTGEPLRESDFQPWFFGEPNGERKENCQIIWPYRNSWNDYSCDNTAFTFCDFDGTPLLQLRGLCHKSSFDTKFSWDSQQLVNGRHSFNGFTDSYLTWDASNARWMLKVMSDSGVFATHNESDYPLGTRLWNITNDGCGVTGLAYLSLSTCTEDHFNCNDGGCVDLNSKCDGVNDCHDRSDEHNCNLIFVDKSYLKHVPAPPRDSSVLVNEVDINVEIMSILDISEVGGSITIQFSLHLTWFDRRLTFENLKTPAFFNTLNKDAMQHIWLPKVVFSNTRQKLTTVDDAKASVTILRNGTFELAPLQWLHNSHVYSGSDNPLTLSRVYSVEFLCGFAMNYYPFDTQQCQMDFVLEGGDGHFARLKPRDLDYLGPLDLTQYFVRTWSMKEYKMQLSGTSSRVVRVNVTLGRRLLSVILTTYLPTILICAVSFSTNFFQHQYFEAIVAVNLTSMLVLTTLFISVSNSLPSTSYIKMIDIWLISMLLMPFIEVLMHTFLESLRHQKSDCNLGRTMTTTTKKKKKNKNKKNKKLVRVGSSILAWRCIEAETEMTPTERSLLLLEKVTSRASATLFVAFAVVYFCYAGLLLHRANGQNNFE